MSSVNFKHKERIIPSNLQTVADFLGALQSSTSSEQRKAVYEAMKDNDIYDLNEVLKCLPPEKCEEACGIVEGFINNTSDFRIVISGLTPQQSAATCLAMKDSLPKIINNADDFKIVCELLPPEQRKIVYDAVKSKVPEIIQNNAKHFRTILAQLSLGQCSYDYVNDVDMVLLQIINNTEDLKDVLHYLSPAQCAAVFIVIKDKLPQIIKNSDDLKDILRDLLPPQCKAVCIAMKDKLPEIIKNSDDLKTVLRPLSSELRMAVFEGMQEHLPQIIKMDELLGYFPDVSEKRKIQEIYFACLLQEAKMKSLDFSGDEKAKAAVEELSTVLKGASENYFKTPTPESYKVFKTTCDKAIETASDALKGYRGWKDFFAKLTLTIVSLGIIPAALSVVSKATTGKWGFSLFPVAHESKLEEISEAVNQIGKGISPS